MTAKTLRISSFALCKSCTFSVIFNVDPTIQNMTYQLFLKQQTYTIRIKLLMIYGTFPAYTIAKKLREPIHQQSGEEHCSPGPKYNLTGLGNKTNGNCVSIGNSNRVQLNKLTQKTPSPTHYNADKLKSTAFGYSIPHSSHKQQPNNNPDPACYNPQHTQTKFKTTNFTIGTKYDPIIANEKNPGPGEYETSSLKDHRSNSMNKLFGVAPRFSDKQADKPGPGNYEVTNEKWLLKSCRTIATADRNIKNKDITPGPGDYHKPSFANENIQKKAGKTISGRFRDNQNSNSLTKNAFLNYHQTKPGEAPEFKTAKRYSIGKSERQTFNANNLPGPQDYANDYRGKTNFHAIIPKSLRSPINPKMNTPGPGAYEAKETVSQTRYTIPRSHSEKWIQSNPGVGRYQIEKQGIGSQQGIAIAKSKRTSFVSNNQAGVGDYNLIKSKIGNITIPKAERFPKTQNHKPGPGDYHIHTTISNLHFYTKKNSFLE